MEEQTRIEIITFRPSTPASSNASRAVELCAFPGTNPPQNPVETKGTIPNTHQQIRFPVYIKPSFRVRVLPTLT